MNNQKDTQKTNINLYGHNNVRDIKLLSDMSIFGFINKRTEKLVTALYLVSDCMDTDDALKGKIRLLGVELLSDIHKLSVLSPIDKNNNIIKSLNLINEILAFIEVAYTIGLISEMNTMILKKEFSTLTSELNSEKIKDKHFTFTLDQKMFEVVDENNQQNLTSSKGQEIKDKKTPFNNMSFENYKSLLSTAQFKKTDLETINAVSNKEDRKKKIIEMIKDLSLDKTDKKNTSHGQDGVSIKDISLAFTDCSEKTIQRELNSLVLNGKLKKTGAKRWSRYSIVSDN